MTFDAAGNPDAGQRFHVPDQVFAGDDFEDAGHFFGVGRVNRLDERVGVRAAQNFHVHHVRQRQVGDKGGASLKHAPGLRGA